MIVLFLVAIANKEKNQNKAAPDIVMASPQDSVVILNEFDVSLQELISINRWGRNPFLPYYSLSTDDLLFSDLINSAYRPELKKIFCKRGSRQALLNNQMVEQGDKYLDMKVQYIGESIVILEKNDSPYMLLKVK